MRKLGFSVIGLRRRGFQRTLLQGCSKSKAVVVAGSLGDGVCEAVSGLHHRRVCPYLRRVVSAHTTQPAPPMVSTDASTLFARGANHDSGGVRADGNPASGADLSRPKTKAAEEQVAA